MIRFHFSSERGPVKVKVKRNIPAKTYGQFENAVRNQVVNTIRYIDSFMWRTATYDESGMDVKLFLELVWRKLKL